MMSDSAPDREPRPFHQDHQWTSLVGCDNRYFHTDIHAEISQASAHAKASSESYDLKLGVC
jgi:hypothetical protein